MNKEIISFDLWHTLIKANPNFTEKFVEILNEKNIDVDLIDFKEYKQWYKDENIAKFQNKGIQPQSKEIFNDFIFPYVCTYKHDLYERYQELALEYPPLLLDNAKEVLSYLKDKYNLRLVTNLFFFSSETIQKILEDLKINIFNEFNGSDVARICKPNNLFYINNQTKQILHIGDDETTDGQSIKYGIPNKIINDNFNLTHLFEL